MNIKNGVQLFYLTNAYLCSSKAGELDGQYLAPKWVQHYFKHCIHWTVHAKPVSISHP